MNEFKWTEDSNLEQGEAWKQVVKSSRYSPVRYRRSMEIIHNRIRRIEKEKKMYERLKSMENMSYENWLTLHNGYKDE